MLIIVVAPCSIIVGVVVVKLRAVPHDMSIFPAVVALNTILPVFAASVLTPQRFVLVYISHARITSRTAVVVVVLVPVLPKFPCRIGNLPKVVAVHCTGIVTN